MRRRGTDIAGRIVAKHMRAGTPPAVVHKLNAQVNAIVQGTEVREQFGKLGIAPAPMKPDEFGKFVRDQIATYRAIVKDAGIPPQ